MRILVVDDEKAKRLTLRDDLAAQGHDVVTAPDGEEALQQMTQMRFDVVVTDLRMPKTDGFELLKCVKEGPLADTEVIMMTAYGSIPLAVEAVKLGAFDFLTKPFRNEEIFPLLTRIELAKEAAKSERQRTKQASSVDIDQSIVGHSTVMDRVKRMVEISTHTDSNVLLCGETGVGKDLIASIIHRNSHRRGAPFVKVGCTLFPPQLIESELYGHERGSFTGADQQREGHFDKAQKGSLYLDDVDDIPIDQQPKLLRAIEEKVFERVGGTSIIEANVRIIASTKQNLLERIAEGTFRGDLYYRLDVLRISIPALRERLEDVPALAEHLLQRIANNGDCKIDSLFHTLERAYLVGSGHVTADLLSAEMRSLTSKADVPNEGFQAAMQHAERQLLENALRSSKGNKTAAAAALGMKPSTFRDRLVKHGLQ
ncbi:MAG: sigma-54-dependent Fis family transcriptional regulator [Planctomycetes bacterium]|nr:sigma-54-dependent Fis family transcriptional regulator [Planctomycetota bacterium]